MEGDSCRVSPGVGSSCRPTKFLRHPTASSFKNEFLSKFKDNSCHYEDDADVSDKMMGYWNHFLVYYGGVECIREKRQQKFKIECEEMMRKYDEEMTRDGEFDIRCIGCAEYYAPNEIDNYTRMCSWCARNGYL